MSRDSFAEDYAVLVSKLGPALKLYHHNGLREYFLPRGVVVEEVEADPSPWLNAIVKVGPHRFQIAMNPRGQQHIKLLLDQPDFDDAVDALHAAEGC